RTARSLDGRNDNTCDINNASNVNMTDENLSEDDVNNIHDNNDLAANEANNIRDDYDDENAALNEADSDDDSVSSQDSDRSFFTMTSSSSETDTDSDSDIDNEMPDHNYNHENFHSPLYDHVPSSL
ncbi:fibrinogen-binding protein-like, partial [Cotesia glomerata]|uniref:fibrinogen-binding protein-like n=1 Tax=Cotesia glomerata TaxID=32391 RepID=UPI001D012CA7